MPKILSDLHLSLVRCPDTSEAIIFEEGQYLTADSRKPVKVDDGILLFAENPENAFSKQQQEHYDRVSSAYIENLSYPHTQEYMCYLDDALLSAIEDESLGVTAELCCGSGEAFALVFSKVTQGIGVDISTKMLLEARDNHPADTLSFIQGDATNLPLVDGSFDSVFMLGGIHHVPDRDALFREISRILKPGGKFYWREPVSDFWSWRVLRGIVYRVSPMLEHESERPLLYSETAPVLEKNGLSLALWKTYGFFGFCIFMNSDVLYINRFFRFIPGIRAITRFFTRLDDLILRLPGLSRAGLQVVGIATKNGSQADA